jgi:uncharacterized repeat protein (TIGR01451 family)
MKLSCEAFCALWVGFALANVGHADPSGRMMAAQTGAPGGPAMAAPAATAPINAAYVHTPAPKATPDLPPGSGPTMNSLTIYEVFWLPSGHFGSSASDDTTFENLLQQFAKDLNATQYYNVVTQYFDPSNGNLAITNSASFGGSWVDTTNAYPHAGTTADPLGDADIQAEVHRAVVANGWTQDINHIVAVFVASGIHECDASGVADGHCTFDVSPSKNGFFCAYHSNFTDSGNDALYAFMSYDDFTHQAGGTCVAGETSGDNDPNRGNYPNAKGADAEVSTLSHELIEAVTDPHPNNAWTASDGEIGDKCNFNYSPRNDNGADVFLNGHPYIVQQEFSNAVHTCAIDLCGGGVCDPTVSFSKSVDNAHPQVTRSATYTISLNNSNDTAAATNLVVTDTVPSGYVVTSLLAPGSTSSSSTVNSITVNYDTLAVHQARTITVRVTVPTQAGISATNCGNVALDDLLVNPLSALTTSPCATTTPQLIPSTVVYTGPTTQDFHDQVVVSAHLQDDLANPIASASLMFTLNGSETCSASTDGSGNASCPITPQEAAGTYSLVTSYAGSTVYAPSSKSTSFVVTREETTTTYAGPTIIANGMPVTLSGVLLEDGATPITGRMLTLSIGSGLTQQSCTGTTDATGTAMCPIPVVAQPLGPGVAGAVFAGDAFYLPSSASVPILLFAYTQGGSFVVGDASVGPIAKSIGEMVSFWGASWAEINALNGGPAPSDFKGFANNPLIPQVGKSWTSFAGDSDHPPATVPLYTAMIVATTVDQTGPVVTGDDVHVIIVKTGPGYLPDPGHPGTGIIAGVLQ